MFFDSLLEIIIHLRRHRYAVAVILFLLAAAMVSDSNMGEMTNDETVLYTHRELKEADEVNLHNEKGFIVIHVVDVAYYIKGIISPKTFKVAATIVSVDLWFFVTEEDIKSLPCFQEETLIAIKARHGTTLEVPDPDEAVEHLQRRYRIVLRTTMGPIDVYLVSQFEEKVQEMNHGDENPSITSTSKIIDNPTTEMTMGLNQGPAEECK